MVYTQNIIEHVLARNMLLILSWYTNIEQYTHTHTHTNLQCYIYATHHTYFGQELHCLFELLFCV